MAKEHVHVTQVQLKHKVNNMLLLFSLHFTIKVNFKIVMPQCACAKGIW